MNFVPLHRAGDAIKGAILSRERMAPLNPQENARGPCPLTPPLQASSSKNCGACRIECLPGVGAKRLGLLLSSLPLCLRFATLTQFPSTSDLCGLTFACQGGIADARRQKHAVIPVYHRTYQCGERSKAAFRTQSAAVLPSHAPHDSKARLQDVTNRRRFMAKPCTPHPIAQRVQSFELQAANVKAFLLDGHRPFSFPGKKMGGASVQRLRRCKSPRHQCRKKLRTCAKKQRAILSPRENGPLFILQPEGCTYFLPKRGNFSKIKSDSFQNPHQTDAPI